MGLTTASLITELREHLGALSTTELSNADALVLLNRSYWELLDKFPFREKEATATFVTSDGGRNYHVPNPFEALRQLSIQELDSELIHVLERKGVWEYEKDRSESDDDKGFPTGYYREGSKIRLDPVPDDIYTVTIKYWTVLDDLDAADTPAIPQSWHEIILFGAIWRGFQRLRDFEAATYYKGQQIAFINSAVPTEAKEETDSRVTGLEVLGRDYP